MGAKWNEVAVNNNKQQATDLLIFKELKVSVWNLHFPLTLEKRKKCSTGNQKVCYESGV